MQDQNANIVKKSAAGVKSSPFLFAAYSTVTDTGKIIIKNLLTNDIVFDIILIENKPKEVLYGTILYARIKGQKRQY